MMGKSWIRLRSDERMENCTEGGPVRGIMSAMVHRVIVGLAEEGNANVEKLKSEMIGLGNRVK